MVKAEDLEYVNLQDHADIQQGAAELSRQFIKHIQNCNNVLSDLKIKHIAIHGASRNIGAMLADLKDVEQLMMKDMFRGVLEHEKKLELTQKDVHALKAQVAPEKEAIIHNEEALRNLSRNLADLRLHLGV